MRNLIILLAFVACFFMVSSAYAQVQVKGYTRSNGTYVQPHMRSAPDSTTSNNWSHIGNVNPYTGQSGTHTDTRSSFGTPSPSYPAYPQENRTRSIYQSNE